MKTISFGGRKRQSEHSENPPAEDENFAEDLINKLSNFGNSGDVDDDGPRMTGVYGPVTEEKCSEIIYYLNVLRYNGMREAPIDPKKPKKGTKIYCEPIDFVVSTFGGDATEMFALYDMMRIYRDEMPIRTLGLGKVMSSGVLLLAAGTKGERRVARNCKIMLHGVFAGPQGTINDLKNEINMIKDLQNMYVTNLAAESKMTLKQIKKIFNKSTDTYITPEEAVAFGIVDEIV
jgi:ATP-dependent Clp protease protease subunit